ncbi:MAG: PP2C family protein-serine/threonine phosphatase, partial [Tepidisphaeraceae bacterium]
QPPARVATEMNRRFRASDHDRRFLTMGLCVLDTSAGRLHFTSAGHPPALILRGNDAVAAPDAGGFPIAIVDGAKYDDAALQLEPGDRVYLYSDGVSEQLDAAGMTQFGTARLLALLQAQGGATLAQAVASVVDTLAAWAGTRSFTDDVSVVGVEWRGA